MRPIGIFGRCANYFSYCMGRPAAFGLAVAVVLVWGFSGPLFSFSDTWQLVINTGTTIVTFLMVFLIQNSQNRDSAAIQLKLDEIIRSIDGAHNTMLDLEKLSTSDLDAIRALYQQLAEKARSTGAGAKDATGAPDVQFHSMESSSR
jgi:low affinity Fe/Cu permease